MDKTISLFDSIINFVPQFILSLIIIAGFLVLWVTAKAIIDKIFDKKSIKLKNHIALFIAKTISTIIFGLWTKRQEIE